VITPCFVTVITPPAVDKDSKDERPEDVEGKLKETQQHIEQYKCKCSIIWEHSPDTTK